MSTAVDKKATPAVVVAIIGVLLVVGLAAWAIAGRDDGDEVATDTASDSSTPGATETPAAPVDLPAAAEQAFDAGLPPFVPDRVRPEWTVTAAAYDVEAEEWSFALTSDAGLVVVHQRSGGVGELVDTYASGSTQGEDVNLDDVGLGTWSSWESDGAGAVAVELPTSSVIVTAPDVAGAVEVARTLLTYESTGGGEQD